MVIIGLRAGPDRIARRIGVIGSCRILTAFGYVANHCGRGLYNEPPNIQAHGVSQARQLLDWSRGAWAPPSEFAPYIAGPAEPLSAAFIDQCAKDLEKTETIFIEVSQLDELVCEGVYFQQIYFSQIFVQPRADLIFPWWSALTTGEGDLEAAQSLAIKNLGDSPDGITAVEERIIRGLRLETRSQGDLNAAMSELMYAPDKRWIWQPLYVLPWHSPHNPSRMRLRDMLREGVGSAGGEMFDTSSLMEAMGASRSLRHKGKDPHHLSIEATYVLGQAMLEVAEGKVGADDEPTLIARLPHYKDAALELLSEYVTWLLESGRVSPRTPLPYPPPDLT
jgi:hypothetical protein